MNPVYTRVLKITETQAESAGYGLLLTVNTIGPEFEREAVGRLLGHRVDGVILLGTQLSTQDVADLSEQVPVVVVGREVTGVDIVSVDDRVGAKVAIQHLIDLGHRDIAHIDGGPNPGSRTRRRSYEQTMRKNGLAEHVRVTRGNNTERGGVAAAEALLAGPTQPTAIFASNDLAAIGVLAVAQNRGLAVPEDMSIVGFDNTPLSEFAYVNLTTINQPPQIGAAAVELLIERIEDPSRPVATRLFKPELVIRGTTAPLGQGAATRRGA